MVWSMRTLAAFAVTAATEDKKGVVHFPPQPDCPDLATIMATLLCALQVLQVGTAFAMHLYECQHLREFVVVVCSSQLGAELQQIKCYLH